MLAAVAEMEHDLLVEHTQAGLARAKAEGKRLGRPSKTTPEQRIEILRRLNVKRSVSALARLYGVFRANIVGIRKATPVHLNTKGNFTKNFKFNGPLSYFCHNP